MQDEDVEMESYNAQEDELSIEDQDSIYSSLQALSSLFGLLSKIELSKLA